MAEASSEQRQSRTLDLKGLCNNWRSLSVPESPLSSCLPNRVRLGVVESMVYGYSERGRPEAALIRVCRRCSGGWIRTCKAPGARRKRGNPLFWEQGDEPSMVFDLDCRSGVPQLNLESTGTCTMWGGIATGERTLGTLEMSCSSFASPQSRLLDDEQATIRQRYLGRIPLGSPLFRSRESLGRQRQAPRPRAVYVGARFAYTRKQDGPML